MFEIIYIYNYNSQNIEISIPIFLDPLPFLVLQLHPSKIFSTTTTTPVLEAEKARLVQALPAIMAACLARASPAKSSPSYNLLVNFASLLEGYVRWDKKYLERERERDSVFQLRKGLPGPLLLPRSCYRHSLSLCATSIADSVPGAVVG